MGVEVTIERADAACLPLADKSVDLVLSSPPYTDCRTYDDGTLPEGYTASRDTKDWIDWALPVVAESLRISRGAVIWVVGSPTRDRTYQPAAEGLMYRWWAEGWGEHGSGTYEHGSAYRPVYWYRSAGVPGSGGDQWFRANVEYCIAFKRPGPLPWSNNVAMGHKPKWGPGGEMSYRDSAGRRRNQWGGSPSSTGGERCKDRSLRKAKPRPSHRFGHAPDGSVKGSHAKDIAAIANPGNLLKINVGGGHLGCGMAHRNEAPYPEKLCEFFIESLCPLTGTVCDPFGGSGTTAATAIRLARNAKTFDIRTSQVDLMKKRIGSGITPILFGSESRP